MPLSWNEIKSRASTFSNEWKDEVSEDAEAKSFWDGFFNIYGISRRRVATFEQQVKKIDAKTGFIDLLWKGMILVEHKSRGKDLDRAYKQAKDYFPGLTEKELPRYILVSDFERFRLYDLEENTKQEFKLDTLVDHVHLFGFIAGYQKRTYKDQDPVNIEAAELMGKLHDKLKAIGYTGHQLELYLVRLLFCLFADDTSIFERGIFHDYIDLKTNQDGSDLAMHIDALFNVLNTPEANRLKNLDESLGAFPYVNGKLFEERLPLAGFDSEMRKALIECCLLDWGRISPAIFGSLFQSVMDEKTRRSLGAHYTSEKNILKLIKPLFLDDLWQEYDQVKGNKAKLQKFHDKISKLKFLDPACGCGNFLIIAYRELRLLEIDIIKQLLKLEGYRNEVLKSARMDVGYLIKCDVDQFYGIEYEEFPAQIATVSMWLMDHQMNQLVSNTFGEYYVRLPLRKSASIKHGNALRTDWQSLIDPMPWEMGDNKFNYILGNPPFLGKQYQNAEQKKDMELVFNGISPSGALDYVSAWYIRAAQYMKLTNDFTKDLKTVTAFVSTNSITQGEQVAMLWGTLFNKFGIKIHFAHKTFRWGNEAKGNAAVHVVIVGFSNFNILEKKIFEYANLISEPHEFKVKNINPYLVEGKDEFVVRRKQPICNVPELVKGNQPTDNGNFLFNSDEKAEFLIKEPGAAIWFKRFIGSTEFINSTERWCLWLKDISPAELKSLPMVYDRVQKVKEYRLLSPKAATIKKASTPTLFDEIRHTGSDYLVIPEVSSERRKYLPIGYINANVISSNKNYMLPNATLYHFGILNSIMHNVWLKSVTGRLKSDVQYSNGIVYNNFPWPESPSEKQKDAIEKAAQGVLDARAIYPQSSLADLYDPNTMPPDLIKAHQQLDKAIDLAYRTQPFPNETKRIEYLFELYDKYTSGLYAKNEIKSRKDI
ncbi:class I SAM-dependent DNA methyltransferase [Flavihumibacter profundi]|uniref:class I SAM-dependent DNA methyltransferase n=1 Tax=Flavihumibacter profundi TaxID=2716883 RepID=UPI001CC7BFE5|nr:DNA methyltransferase [Flavihumibacter profundi]MBZ5857760.1 N-6 DNA methylase [Flavihumibacter profundi]